MRSRLFISLLIFITLIADLFAIGMREDVGDETYLKAGRNEAPFVPGKEFPDLSCVCAVGQDKKKFFEPFGTGTLIAPRYILTAAHVILKGNRKAVFEKNLSVRFGPDLETPAATAQVARIHTRFSAGSKMLKALGERSNFNEKVTIDAEFSDIAILELSEPVSTITPAKLSTNSSKLKKRTVVAGFGEAGFGNDYRERKWKAPRFLRAAENIIDRDITKNPLSKKHQGGLVMFDFDNGDATRNTLNGLVKSWEDLIGPGKSNSQPLPLEGIGYPGDSGGPAFIYESGHWCITGVCGYGTGFPAHAKRERVQYGDIAVYTRVPSHSEWIESILK